MKTPLVSIIIPGDSEDCRSEAWCASANSALEQSYARIELLVVADGIEATDANVRASSDPRTKLVKADRRYNHGYVAEWNAGLRAMSADVALFLEPGMILSPERVRLVLLAMYGDPIEDVTSGILIDPDHPESASRAAVHVYLRDHCSLLNRNFTPPMGEWLDRLAYHFPQNVSHFLAGDTVRPLSGANDPEPPDTASGHRRLIQYSGWWRRAPGPLAL